MELWHVREVWFGPAESAADVTVETDRGPVRASRGFGQLLHILKSSGCEIYVLRSDLQSPGPLEPGVAEPMGADAAVRILMLASRANRMETQRSEAGDDESVAAAVRHRLALHGESTSSRRA